MGEPTPQPSNPGPGFGLPPPDTGNPLRNLLSRVGVFLIQVERRFDPFFRPLFDKLLRGPLSTLTTFLINLKRKDEGLGIAEERIQPNEEEHLQAIITQFTAQMKRLWNPGHFERGGNTKTHGIVRAEFIVRDDLPENMRRGIYAEPRTYRAWVRFSGPGPYITRDIDDVGFMSISVKLMGVPGPKLLDDEQETLDMFGVSTPTFVTPDTKANANLQYWSYRNASVFHFASFRNSHFLDSFMQLLWTKTQTSPLEGDYFSCVPYLLGEGQAMQYSFRAKFESKTRVPRLPLRPPDNYLRDAMVATLAERDAEFDVLLPAADRPVQDADREQRRALADEAVAARAGRRAPDPAADVRLAGAARVRAEAHLQPLAHDRRAPPARQPEPGAEADVLRALAATAGDERRRALRADRRRDLPELAPGRREQAQVGLDLRGQLLDRVRLAQQSGDGAREGAKQLVPLRCRHERVREPAQDVGRKVVEAPAVPGGEVSARGRPGSGRSPARR